MNSKTSLRWYEWLLQLLFDRIPYRLDSWVRKFDRLLFRTDHNDHGPRRLAQSPGHSIVLPCLYLALTYFVIVGPTYDMLADNFLPAFVIWLLSFVVVSVLGRLWPRRVYEVQLLGLALVVGSVVSTLVIFDGVKRESDNFFYAHLYLVLAPLLMLVPLVSRWGLRWLFGSLDTAQLQNKFADRFAKVELFEDRGEKTEKGQIGFTWDRLGNALMLALFYNPILLLLPPSVIVLLTQERHDLDSRFAIGLAISFLLLVYGRLRQRWHIMMELVERAMTVGVPLVISIVVILLALGRLLDFSYISIFLDGTRLTVWGYLLAFYVFAWMLEYWINRFLNERFLCFFHPDVKLGDYQFAYQFSGNNVLPVSDAQLKRGRFFQLHGGSRFLVQSNDKAWFHSYNRMALLERLLSIIGDQGAYIDNQKLLNIFARKIRIYFFTLNILLILLVWAFITSQTGAEIRPLYSGTPTVSPDNLPDCDQDQADAQGFRLDCALLNFSTAHAGDNQPDNAILFAASGGGTRAALHTASVLYGLRQQELTDNIVLISGVSGGGVSSAYFSRHYQLLNDNSSALCPPRRGSLTYDAGNFADRDAWRCFFEAMSHPYIKDVVEGMAELRILGPESNGRLLQESLQDHFKLPNSETEGQSRFQTLASHGLLLNTTITGHRFQESQELSRLFARADTKENFYFTIFQGGRLALTNLAAAGELKFPSYAPDEDLALKYRAFQFPNMLLTTAAAMTANFPPVFSDARLCTSENCDSEIAGQSADYFVTDGGATHNQGLISLFAAAHGAVKRLPDCSDGQHRALPRLHVVVAEASFANFDYSEGGRGLGAALSASYGLGHGVVGQQFADLLATYKQKFRACNQLSELQAPSIQVHVIPLPRLFRSRGGMGTHWMMPTDIEVAFPDQADPRRARRISLNRKQLQHYFVNVYSDHRGICQSDAIGNPNFGQLCEALRLSGSVPEDNACTPWLRFDQALNPGPRCREITP